MRLLLLLFGLLCCVIELSAQQVNSGAKADTESPETAPSNWDDRYPFPSIEKILAFQADGCRIDSMRYYAPYMDSVIWRTPYTDTMLRRIQELSLAGVDDPWSAVRRDTLAGISRERIIKHGTQYPLEAFLYKADKLSLSAEWEVWIALSRDGGKHWQHYFTGLYENQPICPKWYSQLPLFVDGHTLQIEAALMQQTGPLTLPFPLKPSSRMIKDGIVVQFDLDQITRDSDGDGWTDILERHLHTNPYRKDTDRDGIADPIDLNPRHNLRPKEMTALYEFLVNNETAPAHLTTQIAFCGQEDAATNPQGWITIPNSHRGSHYCATDSTYSVLIITDDPAIQAIQPKYVRTTILSMEKFCASCCYESPGIQRFAILECKRAEAAKEVFVITYDYKTWSKTFLARKVGNKWQIKLIETLIF